MVRRLKAFKFTLMVVALLTLGCATSSVTKTETITTETIQSPEGNRGNFPYGQTPAQAPQEKTVTRVEKTKKTKETKTTAQGGGILGTTVHAIGWVLALPFKLIAGIIQLIF